MMEAERWKRERSKRQKDEQRSQKGWETSETEQKMPKHSDRSKPTQGTSMKRREICGKYGDQVAARRLRIDREEKKRQKRVRAGR